MNKAGIMKPVPSSGNQINLVAQHVTTIAWIRCDRCGMAKVECNGDDPFDFSLTALGEGWSVLKNKLLCPTCRMKFGHEQTVRERKQKKEITL